MKPVIYTKSAEMLAAVSQHAWEARPKAVYMSTYGLWIGIGESGRLLPQNNDVRHMLHSVKKAGCIVKMNIGLPYFRPCKEGCPHCLSKIEWKRRCLLQSVGYLRRHDIEARLSESVHTKGVAFSDTIVFVGGMNLTGSSFEDICIKMSSRSVMNTIKRGVVGANG